MRRLVKLLVAVDIVLLVAGLSIWLALRGEDERANVANEGLRGSKPPDGQVWPGDLATVVDLQPQFPVRGDVAGAPTALFSTCIDCRSGDVFGGFLGRIQDGDLPDDAQAYLLVWDGDPAAWAREFGIDTDRFQLLHASTEFAASSVKDRLGIGTVNGEEESGFAYLYDPRGTWRSTFAIGQLHVEDIAHDLDALDD